MKMNMCYLISRNAVIGNPCFSFSILSLFNATTISKNLGSLLSFQPFNEQGNIKVFGMRIHSS